MGIVLAALAAVIILVFVGVIICRGIDGISTSQKPNVEAENSKMIQFRLLNPKYDEVETILARIHDEIKNLYANHELILKSNFYVKTDNAEDVYIKMFVPADAQSLKGCWLKDHQMPIAIDDFGNYYFVEIRADDTPCPVFFISHDGDGKPFQIAGSINEFILAATK